MTQDVERASRSRPVHRVSGAASLRGGTNPFRSLCLRHNVLDVEDASPKRNIAMYIGLGTVILIIVLFLLFRGSL